MGSGAAQMGAVMDQEHVIAHARQQGIIIIIFFIIRAAVVVVGLDLGDDDDDSHYQILSCRYLVNHIFKVFLYHLSLFFPLSLF